MTRPLDLRSLRAFLAVAEEGSIRRAAERLHLTQPPLSRQLHAMEDALGGRLLERRASGVSLTPLGHALAKRGRRLLADADDLVRELREHARKAETSEVRIGATHAIAPGTIKRIAAALKRGLRPRAMSLRRDYTSQLARSLRDGSIDFALISAPGDVAGLTLRHLYSDPLVAALPASHPAARKKLVALRDLGDTPFFWNPRSFSPHFYDHCAKVFRASGFRPRYVTVPPAQVVTLERIGQGEGCTLVNQSRAVTRVAGLVYRRLAEGGQLAVNVVAAWRPGHMDETTNRLAMIAHRQLRGTTAR